MSISSEHQEEVVSEEKYSMFNIWTRAVTKPVLATYEDLLEKETNPTLGKAVGWLALSLIISVVISLVLSALFGLAQGLFGLAQGATPEESFLSFLTVLTGGGVSLMCLPVVLPFYLGLGIGLWVIGMAILQAIARWLGGEGDLRSQAYLLAAAGAPMGIVSAVLGSILAVGPVLSVLASLYAAYLSVLGLQAAHRYSRGKAVLTLLIPIIVVAVLVGCMLLLLSPVIEGVYQNIIEQSGGL